MSFGNVIPIDAEVARQLARRQVTFRWLVAGLTTLWLAILVPTVLFTPLPPLAPFAALAALVILAEHRFVLFGDETSMSASIIVIVASIFVFADTAPLAGPLLIASIGGIYLPHLKSRAVSKVAFNGTGMGISAWSAAAVVLAAPTLGGPAQVGASQAAAAVLVYWTLNNLVVAGHQSTLCGERFIRSAKTLLGADTDVLPWAAASGLAAIATSDLSASAPALVACLVLLRVATVETDQRRFRHSPGQRPADHRLIFWISALALITLPGKASVGAVAICLSVAFLMGIRSNHRNPLVAVWLPLLPIALMGSGLATLSCVTLAVAVLAARSRRTASAWTYSVSLGASAAIALMCLWHPQLQATAVSALVYSAAVPLGTSVVFAVLIARRASSAGTWVAIGMALPAGRDLGMMAATTFLALGVAHKPLFALSLATAFIAAAAVLPGYLPSKRGGRFSLKAASPS